MAHLTRKEMKQDKVRDVLVETFVFIENHLKQILIGAAVVIGLVVAGWLTWLQMQKRELQAQEELAEALHLADAFIDPEAPDPDDPILPSFASEEAKSAAERQRFEDLLDRFGGSPVGDVAHVYLGQLDLEAGNEEAAREHWQSFLDSHPDSALAASVERNLLHLDIAAGNLAAVVERLELQLDAKDRSLPEDLVLYELARAKQKLDQDDEATALFQRLVDDFPRSPFAFQARSEPGVEA